MIKKSSDTQSYSSLSNNNNRFIAADRELQIVVEKLKRDLNDPKRESIIIHKKYLQQVNATEQEASIADLLKNEFDQLELEKIINVIKQSALLPHFLFVAAISPKDAIDKISYLIKVGVEINNQFSAMPYNTFMHMLLVNEKFKEAENVLKILQECENKIDLSRTDSEGKNIIITAVRVLAPTKLIKSLLEQGEHLNINHVDQNGRTAVYYACLLGQNVTLELLLSYNADLGSAREALAAPLETVSQTLVNIEIHPLRANGYPCNQLEAIEIEGKKLLANKVFLYEKYKEFTDQLDNMVKRFWKDNYDKLHSHSSFGDISEKDIEQNITYQTINNYLKFVVLGEKEPKKALEFFLSLSISEMKKVKLLLGCRSTIQRHITNIDAVFLKDFPKLCGYVQRLGEAVVSPRIPLESKTIIEKCAEGRKIILSKIDEFSHKDEKVDISSLEIS